jgi:predicted dehydrogenase
MKDIVRICLIGAGRAGMIHALNFKTKVPRARIVAVAEPVSETAEAACRELEITKRYPDYRRALEDDEIDAVVVVTPTSLHRNIAVAAAEAGKHVFCEKPMAMDAAECDDMIHAAQENNVKLQIGFMRRFDDSFLKAKQAVDDGEIGDVVLVRSNTRGPSVPQRWMYDIKKSNGPLAEVNSHDIDTLRWFTGSEFQSVYAIGGNFRCPDAADEFPDFYDNVALIARFKNGMQGSIDGAQGVEYAYDARVEVLGTKGCVYLGQVHQGAFMVCNKKKGLSMPTTSSWRTLFREAYLNEDISFVTSILEGFPPKVTGYDGKMAVMAVNAGNTSIKEKRIVNLD